MPVNTSEILRAAIMSVCGFGASCNALDDSYETATTAVTVEVATVAELRDALITARDNGEDDTVVLTGLTYKIADEGCLASDDDTGDVGDFDIVEAGHRVRIVGKPGVRILSGCNNIRIFDVLEGAELKLEQVELSQGGGPSVGNGGLIRVQGAATLVKTSLVDGYATNGGAIYVGDYANLTVDKSQFEDNFAEAYGGAICTIYADASVTQPKFRNNRAEGFGGAILQAGRELVVTQTEFCDNSVGSATIDDGLGGALTSLGVIVQIPVIERALTQVLDCEFIDNTAESFGGAIASQFTDLRLEDTSFLRNHAIGSGGAVSAAYFSSVYVARSSFEDNTGSGGGALDISQGLLQSFYNQWASNTAVATGGAISARFTPITVGGDDYVGNESQLGGAVSLIDIGLGTFSETLFESNVAGQSGGGLHVGGSGDGSESSHVDVERGSFIGNTAGYRGGAVNLNNSNLSASESTFARNTAGFGGGMTMALHSPSTSGLPSNALLYAVSVIESIGPRSQFLVRRDGTLRVQKSYLESEYALCTFQSGGSIDSVSNTNYVTDDSCDLPSQPGPLANIVGPAAAFAPLDYAAGPTPVFVPDVSNNNPIVDAYPASLCSGVRDQRWQHRPTGLGCDYGAVEYTDDPAPYGGAAYPEWVRPQSPGNPSGSFTFTDPNTPKPQVFDLSGDKY